MLRNERLKKYYQRWKKIVKEPYDRDSLQVKYHQFWQKNPAKAVPLKNIHILDSKSLKKLEATLDEWSKKARKARAILEEESIGPLNADAAYIQSFITVISCLLCAIRSLQEKNTDCFILATIDEKNCFQSIASFHCSTTSSAIVVEGLLSAFENHRFHDEILALFQKHQFDFDSSKCVRGSGTALLAEAAMLSRQRKRPTDAIQPLQRTALELNALDSALPYYTNLGFVENKVDSSSKKQLRLDSEKLRHFLLKHNGRATKSYEEFKLLATTKTKNADPENYYYQHLEQQVIERLPENATEKERACHLIKFLNKYSNSVVLAILKSDKLSKILLEANHSDLIDTLSVVQLRFQDYPEGFHLCDEMIREASQQSILKMVFD